MKAVPAFVAAILVTVFAALKTTARTPWKTRPGRNANILMIAADDLRPQMGFLDLFVSRHAHTQEGKPNPNDQKLGNGYTC